MKERISDTFGEKIGMSRRDIRKLARELTSTDVDSLAKNHPDIFSLIANKEFLWPDTGWSEAYPQNDKEARYKRLCADIFPQLVRRIMPTRCSEADETPAWSKEESYVRKLVATRTETMLVAQNLNHSLDNFIYNILPDIWPGDDRRTRNGRLQKAARELPEELDRIATNALYAGAPEWRNRIIFYKDVRLQPMEKGNDPAIHFYRSAQTLEFENRAHLQGYFDGLAAGMRNYRKKKPVPTRPILENIRRTGASQDFTGIDAETFRQRFAFRGGEFGSWIKQSDRQQSLEWAAGAFADLACFLGLDDKDMGRGRLGISFGARGYGGFYPAAAHYEKFFTVINLTKWHGAGCVAHEWAHFLDFTVLENQKAGSKTMHWLKGHIPATGADLVALRREALKECENKIAIAALCAGHNADEINDKFASFHDWETYKAYLTDVAHTYLSAQIAKKYLSLLYEQIDLAPCYLENDFYANAKALDKRRWWRPYWSTPPELFARVFEKFVVEGMKKRGMHNDYLVALYEDNEINPYPNDEDMELFIPKIQELIETFGSV